MPPPHDHQPSTRRDTMIKLPRGCRDFSPEEMEKRRFLEERFRETAKLFNFREVAMPAFENSELFIRKSGEEIIRQLYTFKDKGDRSLALRPEMTAQVLRFYSSNFQFAPKPLKFFYFGNCFRYERPQKGRYREFWQFGVEIIGSRTPEAAVELLMLAVSMYENAGLKKWRLKIGNVGILRSIFELLGLSDEEKKTAFTLLDKGLQVSFKDFILEKGIVESGLAEFLFSTTKDKPLPKISAGKAFQGTIEPLLVYLRSKKISSKKPAVFSELESQVDNFCRILDLLYEFTDRYVVDLWIARGLDYYTNMVFEIEVPTLGAESQICGGGEYSLDKVFDIDSKGCSGFAIGFDRSLLALEQEGFSFQKPELKVFVIPFEAEGCRPFALKALAKLRKADISADIEISGRTIGKAFKYADKIGAKYVVVVGEDEVKTETVTVKDMTSQTQENVTVDGLLNMLGKS